MTPETRFYQDKKELYQYDKQVSLEDKRREGIKEGIKKGKLEGLKEGQTSMAIAMKKDGADFNLISKYTGLSIEEIEKL